MSDKPTIKKITHIDQVEVGEDECVYFLQYDKEMTQIMLTVKGARPITPQEYMQALITFVNDASEFPEKLFVEDVTVVDMSQDLH